MKKVFKTLSFLLVFGTFTLLAQSCNSSKAKNTTDSEFSCCEAKEEGDVRVYYFHATRRCATCQAVESVSKAALEEYYGDKISFESINRDENKDNPLLEKYKVSGQTLLIVKGGKMVNLTNDAFMYARNSPDKLKTKLKLTIDSLL